MSFGVLAAVEGDTDEPFVRKIIQTAGLDVDRVIVFHGHGELDKKVPHWCQPSMRRPIAVVRDLDPTKGTECASALVASLRGSSAGSSFVVVRIAVRELEAWALSDRAAVQEYFKLRERAIPSTPDEELDPKQTLVNLCRSSSSSSIRRGMVPRPASGRQVGPEFTGLMIEFGRDHWDPERARAGSSSLNRALNALGDWQPN